MPKRLTALLILIVTASCTGTTEGVRPSSPQVSGRPYDNESARSSPLANGQYRFWPGSAPAEVGVAYAYELGVHCNIDLLVDFDGNFWDFVRGDERPPPGVPTEPYLRGVMTLVSEDKAEFEASDGRTFVFQRRPDGPKDINLCS